MEPNDITAILESDTNGRNIIFLFWKWKERKQSKNGARAKLVSSGGSKWNTAAPDRRVYFPCLFEP